MSGEDDHVFQDAQGLVVVSAGEGEDGFDQLLRAEDLGGVESAVDPDYGLAFLRQRARGVVGQALRQRQAARDLLVAIEFLEVLGRRDDGHQLIAPFGGLADRLHRHAVGLRVECAHVLDELGVVRKHVVGANLVTEKLFRRRDLGRGRRLGLRDGQGQHQEHGKRERT